MIKYVPCFSTQIQYSLGPDESTVVKSTFRIDPHTGTLTLAAPLDRETIAQYSFTVMATDGGPKPLSTSARVTIIVKDYNDNPPVFSKDTYITAGKGLLQFDRLISDRKCVSF